MTCYPLDEYDYLRALINDRYLAEEERTLQPLAAVAMEVWEGGDRGQASLKWQEVQEQKLSLEIRRTRSLHILDWLQMDSALRHAGLTYPDLNDKVPTIVQQIEAAKVASESWWDE